MKRLAVVLCVVGLLAALPLSQSLQAKPPEGKPVKVDVLHRTDSAVVNAAGVSLIVGHMISVSENAVAAHLAHGDSLGAAPLDDAIGGWFGAMTWRQVADIWGLSTAGATHASFVLP